MLKALESGCGKTPYDRGEIDRTEYLRRERKHL